MGNRENRHEASFQFLHTWFNDILRLTDFGFIMVMGQQMLVSPMFGGSLSITLQACFAQPGPR